MTRMKPTMTKLTDRIVDELQLAHAELSDSIQDLINRDDLIEQASKSFSEMDVSNLMAVFKDGKKVKFTVQVRVLFNHSVMPSDDAKTYGSG